jgi:hypothetical protein
MPASSQPAVIPQCTLPVSSPTAYQIPPADWVSNIYDHVASPNISDKSEPYKQARYAAFKILGDQTMRWSNYVDIALPDGGNMRITLTYISPELIQGILLNQILFTNKIYDPETQFQGKILAGLMQADQRDESLFLVSITFTASGVAPTNGIIPATRKSISLQIPITEMVLTNSSNITVAPNHDDHSLNRSIPLRETFSGFITYQMTVKNGENCDLLLDPVWNTSISIYTPHLTVNDVDYGAQTWTIRYKSLLNLDMSTITPDYEYPLTTNFGDLSPSTDAPTPLDIPSTAPGYWDGYWELMARYVWEQVLYTNNP